MTTAKKGITAMSSTLTPAPQLRPVADADGAAIASLITAFIIPPLGIIFGWVSINQARRHGFRQSAVSSWGITLGVLFTAGWIIGIVVIAVAASKDASYQACISQAISSGINPSLVCTAP